MKMRRGLKILLAAVLAAALAETGDANRPKGYRSGVHRYEYGDGSVYEGEWKDYKPEGRGKLTMGNGDVWQGRFAGGVPTDTMEIFYRDGSSFRGIISPEGRRTGTLRRGTPSDYTETELLNDVPEEQGTRFVADSLGNFAFSYFLRNGRRVYKSIRRADGSMLTFSAPYVADKDGRMHARIVHEKYTYDGEVRERDMTADGRGSCVWADGGRFEGEWRNGTTWEGRDSLMHFYDVDGGLIGVYTGGESKGLLNGEGRYEFANGDVYVGMFRDGKFEGHGVYTWAASGRVYDGEWRDDAPWEEPSAPEANGETQETPETVSEENDAGAEKEN